MASRELIALVRARLAEPRPARLPPRRRSKTAAEEATEALADKDESRRINRIYAQKFGATQRSYYREPPPSSVSRLWSEIRDRSGERW
jgi:hypothetical protein